MCCAQVGAICTRGGSELSMNPPGLWTPVKIGEECISHPAAHYTHASIDKELTVINVAILSTSEGQVIWQLQSAAQFA